jgi:hypothetical protein
MPSIQTNRSPQKVVCGGSWQAEFLGPPVFCGGLTHIIVKI